MRIILVLLIFCLLSLSCHKSQNCEEPNMDCSTVRCFALIINFDFRLVDKNTGTDLVFGTNPRYTIHDIRLFSDAALSATIPLTVDSTKKIFQTSFASSEMWLEINGANVYKLNADFITVTCCSQKVKNLSLDGRMICTCCSDAIDVPVQ